MGRKVINNFLRRAMRLLPAAVVLIGSAWQASAQGGSAPSIVRPGAPGQPTETLPAGTRAVLPPITPADVAFMQGMIHHHAQAVEMVALMDGRTQNERLRLLGTKISHSQADEMSFMRRWLTARGKPVEMAMKATPAADPHSGHGHHSAHKASMLMPGMLSEEQMKELAAAKGAEFDRLFLKGMIQHHEGALTMVKELFAAPATGQDAELYNFAADVDTGQRAEIKIMQNMLGETSVK